MLITLLPILSTVLERLILKRIAPIIEQEALIPHYQFGFCQEHSALEQIHRVVDLIEKDCVEVFLDVSQAFDRV